MEQQKSGSDSDSESDSEEDGGKEAITKGNVQVIPPKK